MAKIDDSVKKKVPELRFPGFTDDWEERKLRDLLNKNSEKNKNLSVINVESVSNKTGFTKQTDQFEDYSVASADLSNYYVIREKQFAYNPSRINVGSIAYKDLGDEISVVSPLYVSFSTKKILNDGFLWNWFKTASFDAQRQRLSAGGVRDTLSFNQLSEMNTMFPTYPEQQKIGSFFKQLDNTIALHQRKLDLLKEQKKGYLQKMFPKNGAKVPELRFAGFADDWEERKLKDISEIIDGDRGKNYPSGDDFKNNGHTLFLSATNVTKQGFVFKKNQYITNLKSESLGNGKVKLNDIILTSRGSIGHIGFYDEKINEKIPQARINSGMLILRTDKFNSPNFIAQFLKSPLGIKQIKLISFGSAQPQLTKKDIKKFKIALPKIEEQQKIGSLLKQIDNTIALHQRKLDLLKEQKKGFLQNIFV